MEGTDIVIPYLLGKSSEELRYCLRSIEKHLKGVRDIYIIGNKPKWLRGVIVLPFTDNPDRKFKEWNIMAKITEAVMNPDVSEDFLFMNDDHFLLKDFEASEFPIYYKGLLQDTMKKNQPPYRSTLNHSRKLLESKGILPLDFDVHCPHLINNRKFMDAMCDHSVDWKIENGYALKSLYFGLSGISGEQITDCKLHRRPVNENKKRLEGRSFFSTSRDYPEIVSLLQELYPNPSKYEN